MNEKQSARLRRARRGRAKMRELGMTRLSIHRTPRHIYAQVISPEGDKVLASASTLDKGLRSGNTGNSEAAAAVGKLVAERAKARCNRSSVRPKRVPFPWSCKGAGGCSARRRIGILR